MPTAVLVGVALLGGLVGLVVPSLARRFATPPARPRPVRGAWVLLGPTVAASVFAGLVVAVGDDPALPVFLAIAAVGLVLARVDLLCLRLPDPLVLAAGVSALGGLTGAALLSGTPGRLVGALGGAAVAGAAHVLLALLPGSRLGFGDVKLAAVLGAPLGWQGRDALLAGLLLPHLLHGGLVLGLLAARRVRRDTLLPLGPALLAGAWLGVVLG
ncbi:leader peptidase (prepilin peptidase)/N-methyltransferase [Micromonospora jinlongensis]|uniref:Leader peptidase (Prepilin peptidase)/N-methyltransferase n=1 Tax=Micromonospora jinlongensis TaxID=1287877 RepID=A0A7Y9X2P1_9ACTN|nr:prepilin peptidase [Micromonospora jinlongensis]NYH44087.1 leader peptidase (prepilin peptidase)/N-methyltransferase [Micromonospora jinlongensis]